ncbi:MAG: energy-dependent translational throttle protein EttA [Candidatus Cloacimonetes bacterium]|nr:energy-dependent translational throttle protein EttA [Candidatus Cloacimonadota bacterium]MDY0336483.1 energy-dependent translational throttle protein EttA [Candidatus Cloacimonadaceae bacterium]MCK9333867.1 energy-dependent translational throttle protein EttA [Candidatus Cloacimonadota bacterium]MDD2543047.1 energy-dependent translational throttle protein EttA [Candidatus Cloacimonadota bacterium]MDD2682754.1 energy-dependent translational throttle protein EttA [Candidatus Cloacimonadota ba
MEENKVIYQMSGIGKVVDSNRYILKDIYLGYYYGAKIGVVGMNGSGKSTLLKIMAGLDHDFIGEVAMSKGYSIGYLEQDPQLDPEQTVLQIVQEAVAETIGLLQRFEEINMKFMEPMDDDAMNALLAEQGEVQDKLDAANAWDLDSRLELAMDALRCPPKDMPIKLISGGEKRRVALCRLLLQAPDILLLDEPTNHLDAETILWLEHHLKQYKGTVIAITHDRYFLDNVAGWILELDRGEGIPYQGNYSSWLEQKQMRLAQEQKSDKRRQKALADELEWIRSSPKARQAKSKARIQNFEKLSEQSYDKERSTEELPIFPGPKLGNKVIIARDVAKGFEEKLLYENLEFNLPAGGIVGVIGPNGAGKTTLFEMIVGNIQPDHGSIDIGETVKLSYVDQARMMDTNQTLLDLIGQGRDVLSIGGREMKVREYIGKFNFSSKEHIKPVNILSGGEKNRAYLALTLQTGGNVLLLDEPTNDLDVYTIHALEEALLSFPGCAVVISHDRYFLDRVCTHILAFEGESQAKWFEGNFSDYEENKLMRLGEKALIPKRISYRKLTRD